MGQATKETKAGKTLKRVRILLVLAILCTGFLAGGSLDRYLIQVPGFRHIDILSWAQYSRYADLGTGIFLYPTEAVGGFILLLLAGIIVFTNQPILKQVAWPVYLALGFAASGLFFTIFAAPVMLGVPKLGNNPVLVQQAFDKFHFWGLIRAVVQILSFFACTVAMYKMPGNESGTQLNIKNS